MWVKKLRLIKSGRHIISRFSCCYLLKMWIFQGEEAESHGKEAGVLLLVILKK